MAPRQTPWRLDYAELLRQSGDLKEAYQELRLAQGQDPNNRAVKDRLAVVEREMELKGRE